MKHELEHAGAAAPEWHQHWPANSSVQAPGQEAVPAAVTARVQAAAAVPARAQARDRAPAAAAVPAPALALARGPAAATRVTRPIKRWSRWETIFRRRRPKSRRPPARATRDAGLAAIGQQRHRQRRPKKAIIPTPPVRKTTANGAGSAEVPRPGAESRATISRSAAPAAAPTAPAGAATTRGRWAIRIWARCQRPANTNVYTSPAKARASKSTTLATLPSACRAPRSATRAAVGR